MRIAIIGNQRCWHAGKLATALEKRNVEVMCVPAPQMVAAVGRKPRVTTCHKNYAGTRLEDVNALIVRSIPGGSLEQVIFRVDVLHRLEDAGVRVINSPYCIEKTIDKFYASFLFEDHGMATPRTVVTENFDEAMLAFEAMGDIVAKPLFGSLGLGIVRISDADTAYRVFSAWRTCQYVYYLQQFIPHGNSDLRALVVGERVVAAMRRVSDGWKNNITSGAVAERVTLTAAQEDLCLRIASIFHADYLGVDLLSGEDGREYAIEANSAPGWRGLQEVTDFDLASEIADYFIRCAKVEEMAGARE